MKICMITGTFPEMRCGVGDFVHGLCTYIAGKGCDIDIITSKDPSIIDEEGLSIERLVGKWKMWDIGKILKKIRTDNPDIIHIQFPSQAYKRRIMIIFLPLFIKVFVRRKSVIVTVHNVHNAHVLNKIRMVMFFPFAKRIIVSIKEDKDWIVNRFPYLRSKVKVIPIGVNIEPGSDKKYNVDPPVLRISHYGYLLPQKMLEVVIDALKIFSESGRKFEFNVITDFNPAENRYHRKLRDLVEKVGLTDYVVWRGYCKIEEVSKILLDSDFCVQLYKDGITFGRGSFIACLQCGVPTITNVAAKLPEGLRDRENIIAVKDVNLDKLAAAMREVSESYELRKKIGENARDFSAIFSFNKIADMHIQMYKEILER